MYAAAVEEEEVRSGPVPARNSVLLFQDVQYDRVLQRFLNSSRIWSSTRTAQTGICQSSPRTTRPTGTRGALCARGSWHLACVRCGVLPDVLAV